MKPDVYLGPLVTLVVGLLALWGVIRQLQANQALAHESATQARILAAEEATRERYWEIIQWLDLQVELAVYSRLDMLTMLKDFTEETQKADPIDVGIYIWMLECLQWKAVITLAPDDEPTPSGPRTTNDSTELINLLDPIRRSTGTRN